MAFQAFLNARESFSYNQQREGIAHFLKRISSKLIRGVLKEILFFIIKMILDIELDLWLSFGEFGESVTLSTVLQNFLILLFENFP